MSDLLRTYERGILRVTLNRPAKRNALAMQTLRELRRLFEAHAELEDLRLAMIGGAGEAAFCSGGDLADLADVRTREATEAFAAEGTAALDAIRLFPVPTVALLNGLAIGGGAELALACDMRLAAPHARIGYVHANLNITAAWGGGADLTRLVGPALAMELVTTGRILSAEEARALGLVNQIAPTDVTLIDFAERFIEPMRERPPHVMSALKAQVVAERMARPVPDRRAGERDRFVDAWIHPAHWLVADEWLRRG